MVFNGPGSMGGSVSKVAVNVRAWPSSRRHIFDVGRIDRLQPALAQRLVDGARNEIVGHIVKDLFAEAFLDERRRHLSLSEAGNARLPAVAPCHAIDLSVDDVARNFDGDALLRFGEIGEFGFHYWIIPCGGAPSRQQTSIVRIDR